MNKLIKDYSGYKTLSFMGAYSGYNHIKMDLVDVPKMIFMSNKCNYYYNVMPFRLKNASATYQTLMNILVYN